jgi:hypothetical protein
VAASGLSAAGDGGSVSKKSKPGRFGIHNEGAPPSFEENTRKTFERIHERNSKGPAALRKALNKPSKAK